MKTIARSFALSLVIAGCAGEMPDSNPRLGPGPGPGAVETGRGVGLGDYRSYEAERLARERALRGLDRPADAPAPAISPEDLRAAGLPSGGADAPLPEAAPVERRPLDGPLDDPALSGAAPDASAAPAAGPVRTDNPGISDEQSFAAVAARETIESDAERLARQRAAYQVVAPEAVPSRDGAERPNIVQYALSTTNRLGQPVYSRGGLFAERRFRKACLEYPSSDLAQEAFLARGGPQKDPLGVDPDGDGFACAWDPAPFRAAEG